jgi:hypothetical protein
MPNDLRKQLPTAAARFDARDHLAALCEKR